MRRRDPLNEAMERIERLVPRRMRRAVHWLHSPRSRPVRIPLGIVCIVASFFWFLPIIGMELFPIGLLLIAHDVPFLRRPAGKFALWLLDWFERMQHAWHRHWAHRAGR
jgi:hypothetical protein